MRTDFLCSRYTLLSLLVLLFLAACAQQPAGAPPQISKPQVAPQPPPAGAPPVPREPAPMPELAHTKRDVQVALLLPLSGPSAQVGKDLRDAAQLALFDLDLPHLKLLPIDTRGTTQGAKNAAFKAVEEDADIILGPLFSHTTQSVLPIAQQNRLKVVSFSNNAKLAQEGAYIFGFMPQQQLERVLEHAIRNGIRDFYALVPKDAFGESAVSALHAVKTRQEEITIHDIAYYGAGGTGIAEGVKAIASKINEQKESETATPISYGLLMPEGGSNLIKAAKILRGFELSSGDVRMMGGGQWDNPELAKVRRLYGSWYASADPAQRTAFVTHFKQTYGYEPVRIASLAYDGVSLVGFISSLSGPNFSQSALINRRGFSGIDGVFRFKPNRVNERALAVMEVIPGNIEVVSPAPQSFAR